MNRTKLTWTVANIEKMHRDKKVLSFDHPIQRKSEMWNNAQKSLLIHSMLANYPVPNVYVLREDSEQADEKGKPVFNYYVLDGKQRLTSTLSYIWGEFPLDDNIPNIMVEDTEYEIAGKYFCDLEEPVQFEIKRYKFEIIAFEECCSREIEEIFFRLNNSTALTKSQIAKAKVGVELAGMINELLASKFFTVSCNFTGAQIKASDDQRCLLQSMMLLDTNYVSGFELKDFSEVSILEYSESIRENYSDKQCNLLKSAIQYLSDAFPEKNRQIRKISIPMLLYLADVAEDAEIKPRFFRQWWEYFTEEDELMEDYKAFCSSGSTKLEKIRGRLSIMVKSFCIYHEIEVPEELKEVVAETEEKLTAMEKENAEGTALEETENLLEEMVDGGEPGIDNLLEETENKDVEEKAEETEEAALKENASEEDPSADDFSGQEDNTDNQEATEPLKDSGDTEQASGTREDIFPTDAEMTMPA